MNTNDNAIQKNRKYAMICVGLVFLIIALQQCGLPFFVTIPLALVALGFEAHFMQKAIQVEKSE